MYKKQLVYEFWDEKDNYTDLFESKRSKEDRQRKRIFFAEEIAKLGVDILYWLDVGIGDGKKMKQILDHLLEIKPSLQIHFVVVEPSQHVKEQLKTIENHKLVVSFSYHVNGLSLDVLAHDQYHLVTFFHSTYYIAKRKAQFISLFQMLLLSLKCKGLLMIQAVHEDSDFQKIGKTPYSVWAQGKHTYSLLKRIFPRVSMHEFPTHYDVEKLELSSQFTDESGKKLAALYQFTAQKNVAQPTKSELRSFFRRVRRLMKKKKRDGFDFNDIVVCAYKD